MLLLFRALIGISSHSRNTPPPFLLGQRVLGGQNLLHPGPPGPRREGSYQEEGPWLIRKVHLALIPACPHLSPLGILLLYLPLRNFLWKRSLKGACLLCHAFQHLLCPSFLCSWAKCSTASHSLPPISHPNMVLSPDTSQPKYQTLMNNHGLKEDQWWWCSVPGPECSALRR